MSLNHPLSNDWLNCCITCINSPCPENVYPEDAISTVESKQSLVGQGQVSMVDVQLSVDPTHQSPAVSWQRYDYARCPGEE